jgi:hypothetical protein
MRKEAVVELDYVAQDGEWWIEKYLEGKCPLFEAGLISLREETENIKKSPEVICQLRFEPNTSQIRVKSITAMLAPSVRIWITMIYFLFYPIK